MKYLLVLLIFWFPISIVSQTLIKTKDDNKIELSNSNKIFSSNAGYCKIYKLDNNIFVLHNGYSELKRKMVIDRKNLDEIIRASRMILEADDQDVVRLETLPMEIKKGKAIGELYSFTVYNTSKTLDFELLTLEEANQLLNSSDLNSVTVNGEKVIDKVNTIEAEVEESFMSLSKGQLKKLIQLEY